MTDNRRYIAIGDVHGCAISLKRLIKTIESEIDKDTILVFLGDYIDRGPSSSEVIDYLISLQDQYNCIFIRGNHDQMMLDAVNSDQWGIWLQNGGKDTLDSYSLKVKEKDFPGSHIDFIRQTRLYWETSDYLFVHGGIDPEVTVEDALNKHEDHHSFLWERAHIKALENNWEKTVVFGHTPVKEPLIRDQMLGMDTGCVYPHIGYGKLSAMILPEMDLYQQECLDL